jgi:hypothetical protein
LDPIRFRDMVSQFRHGISNVNRGSLDVVSRRCAHIRMSEDSLNHHVRHTEAVQVTSQSAPRSVPAVPLGEAKQVGFDFAASLID